MISLIVDKITNSTQFYKKKSKLEIWLNFGQELELLFVGNQLVSMATHLDQNPKHSLI